MLALTTMFQQSIQFLNVKFATSLKQVTLLKPGISSSLAPQLECCGVFGPDDYHSYSHTLPQNGSICNMVLDETNELTADGCAKLVFNHLDKLARELFYVSAVYSGLQVVQIICLFNMLF